MFGEQSKSWKQHLTAATERLSTSSVHLVHVCHPQSRETANGRHVAVPLYFLAGHRACLCVREAGEVGVGR